MANKPTCQELEQEIKQLEKEVHDCKSMEAALKDHVGYQSVLSVLRGVGPEQTEEVLLQTFLSEIVKQYGFCMSWYGQYSSGKIRPILSAGRVDRYLDNLVLEIREPTSPDAQCAMSKAILKAAPFTYADLEKDEGFRQWRDYAIELGYRSNLALPLEVEGQVEGGVMVYADTPKAFPEERIQRLQLLTSEAGAILRGRRMRERVEVALKKSEQMYRTLVETSHDMIFIVDLKGNFLFTNKAFESILGYSDKDREKVNGFDLVHPEDLDHVSKRFAGLIEGRRANNIEYRYRIKDGSYIHILTSASPIFDSQEKVVSAFGIARDVTDLKRAEEALRKGRDELEQRVEERTIELTKRNEQLKDEIQGRKRAEEKLLTYHKRLRSLASDLSLAEERERRRIATEVHDNIGQHLVFAKLKLGILLKSVTSPDHRTAVDEVSKLVDETIQDTRSLIYELGSPVLYELGFVSAVQWLTQQTSKRHSIPLDFEDDGQPKLLSDGVRVLLFQAVRELLANIVRHSRAQKAKVTIARNEDEVRVNVRDDGIGFDPADVGPGMDENGGFGLFSIGERLEPLGGHMKVASKPGQGTQVTLVGPVIS